MNKEALKFITINRDATAVNRGFYYQYLNVLLKWVEHFIQRDDTDVFTEVDDDIKEVGDKLVFTQVKCYSSGFSLQSTVIQKALFNFFGIYLLERENVSDLRFVFQTNTSVSPKETLLSNWVEHQSALSAALLVDCADKTEKIVGSELKKIRDRQLSTTSLAPQKKKAVKAAFQEIQQQLSDCGSDFVKRIRWEFLAQAPDTAVELLYQKILGLLFHERFESKPAPMLMEVMLSEIYRCSQLKDRDKRVVNNRLLTSILQRKTEELDSYANRRFLDLLDMRFGPIYQAINEMQEEIKGLKLQVEAKTSFKNMPRLITSIPYIDPTAVFQRNEDAQKLHECLNGTKHLLINGFGGMGKSTLAKYYLQQFQEEYDHIIWLDAQPGILKSIIFQQDLQTHLGIEVAKPDNEENVFREALRLMNQMEGNNLLVIDDFADEQYLKDIKSLKNWKVLFTSRKRLPNTDRFALSVLTDSHAKALYRKHEPDKKAEEEVFTNFFSAVEYNPLVIEIAAKTIQNSIDLDLKAFTALLKNQALNESELQIDIEWEDEGSGRLLQILQKTFDISGLEQDAHFLEFLSVLPSAIKISDLIKWYGDDYARQNKVSFANITSRLHQKGWIERDGDDLYIHKMLQESILYRMREPVNGFIVLMFQLDWLSKRIREGIDSNYNQALQFLRYGESILDKIKEPYREQVYQPLLVVENEVLNVYNWIIGESNTSARLRSLLDRSIAYLGPDDPFVGIVHNNLGMSLAEKHRFSEAEPELIRSIEILKPHAEKSGTQLLYAICNLAMLYIQIGQPVKFQQWFDEGMSIRKRQKLYDDSSFPFQCNLLGFAQQTAGNYKEAVRLLEIAVVTHQQLPVKKKNDLNLVLYLNNLSYSYFLDNRHERAVTVIGQAVLLLQRLTVKNDNKLVAILIHTLIEIMKQLGSEGDLASLLEALEKIKALQTPG